MQGYALRPLLHKLVLFLAVNALVLNGILWAVSPIGFKETVLHHAWGFVHAKSGGDSWGQMAVAYDYVQQPHSALLYTEVFFNQKVKFQYPPSALFAIAAMHMAGVARVHVAKDMLGWTLPDPGLTRLIVRAGDILGWAFILLMIISIAALLYIRLKQNIDFAKNRISLALCAVIVCGFTLTFYPVMKAYTLGQIQVWLNSLFALALLMWVMGRHSISGVLIGLICLVKPHFALFLIWALVRREWSFVVAFAATALIGLAASVATFGWANHIDYLSVLSYMAERGEAYYPNQSVNGLLNRLMSVSDPEHFNNLIFNRNKFPPYNPWVYSATLISSSVILLAAIVWRSKPEDRVFDFCRMAISLTVASPIAWEHHYGILLPIFAIMLPSVIADRARMIWLMISYVLVSTFVPATNLLALSFWNVGQSYLLVGAFILLALLYYPSTACGRGSQRERQCARVNT
jgi:alpha-1,2-mannosyltransferase